jgi:hypothetical protein
MMDQPILFYKPNKKVRNENKIDHFIPQTKHTLKVVFGSRVLWNDVAPFLFVVV